MMSTLGNLMTKNPVTIPHDASVRKATQLMQEKSIGSLLVEEDGRIVGIITETDVVRKAGAEGRDLAHTTVQQIMTHPILSLEASRSPSDAQDMMADRGIRHVVVTDAGTIVGLVSVRDILAYFTSVLEPKIGVD